MFAIVSMQKSSRQPTQLGYEQRDLQTTKLVIRAHLCGSEPGADGPEEGVVHVPEEQHTCGHKYPCSDDITCHKASCSQKCTQHQMCLAND